MTWLKEIIEEKVGTISEAKKKLDPDFPLGIIIKNSLYAEWDGRILRIMVAGIELMNIEFDEEDGNATIVSTNFSLDEKKFEEWVNKNYQEWLEKNK